ncbi:MAG: hypothetical protein Q8M29_01140 [Bacteroidota bacterium]|nr:hypothetical protein [Bacteroidota bacterium]
MKKTTIITTVVLLLLSLSTFAQKSYAEFQGTYKPHNKLNEPENQAVKVVGYLESSSLAGIMEEYAKNKDKRMFQLIISSVDRKKAGEALDAMKPKLAIKGLNMLDKEWVPEVVFYASEKTYNELSPKVDALKNY